MKTYSKNLHEREFECLLHRNGWTYIYHPNASVLREIGYTPDYYVFDNDCYYEVVGTRQAFHNNKFKIFAAQNLVNLEIVKPDGTPYFFQVGRVLVPNKAMAKRYCGQKMAFDLKTFADDRFLTHKQLAVILQCGIVSVGNMQARGTMSRRYLQKLQEHYGDIEKYIGRSIEQSLPDKKKIFEMRGRAVVQ